MFCYTLFHTIIIIHLVLNGQNYFTLFRNEITFMNTTQVFKLKQPVYSLQAINSDTFSL